MSARAILPAACLAVLLAAAPAVALEQPRPAGADSRIRVVSWHPDDVIQVNATVGIATHIQLQEGEQVLTHAFGDAAAWSFAVRNNHLFLKPAAENASTNLMVVTDRRSYAFRLTLRADPASAAWQIRLVYPDSLASETARMQQAAALDQGFRQRHGPYNLSYTMAGDMALAPVHAWDDGLQTFIQFSGQRDVPAIYLVDENGAESTVNRTTTGAARDIVVLHRTAGRWMLRLGDQALMVFNEAWNPDAVVNDSATTSPAVRRTVKGGRK